MLAFINCGSMFSDLTGLQTFDVKHCKFYAAQFVLSLENLLYADVIYSDMKSEKNVLVNIDGYLKWTDCGFYKLTTTSSCT